MKTSAERNGPRDRISLTGEIQCVWMNAGKKCLHMLTGHVPFKLCARNYECQDCAYDQLLDDYDRLLGQEKLPITPAPQIKAAHINRGPDYLVPIPAY
jgi:hypothetical protein